jgi:hypothetical protein
VRGHTVVSGQIIRHADNIQAVRERFAAVKDASASIAHDDSAYGLLCRWITEDFQARHVRQDELAAHVEENLRLVAEALWDIAKVGPVALDPVRVASSPSLIAPVTVRSVARTGWLTEHVEPMRELLDHLAGKPDVIASHAATWRNMAVELWSMGEELEDLVECDISGWHGDDADEHRRLMAANVEAVKGLSSVSAALGEVTESVEVLVAQTRRLVRDLVTDLLALTLPRPSSAVQDGTLARWARRIAVYAVALNTSLTQLDKRLNG